MTKLDEAKKIWDSMGRECKDAFIYWLINSCGKNLITYTQWFVSGSLRKPECKEENGE